MKLKNISIFRHTLTTTRSIVLEFKIQTLPLKRLASERDEKSIKEHFMFK